MQKSNLLQVTQMHGAGSQTTESLQLNCRFSKIIEAEIGFPLYKLNKTHLFYWKAWNFFRFSVDSMKGLYFVLIFQ